MSFLQYKPEAGWAVTQFELAVARTSFKVEERNIEQVPYGQPIRREPPEGCAWSGPWEPFATTGLHVVWRRPYVPIVTEDDTRLAGDTTFAERR